MATAAETGALTFERLRGFAPSAAAPRPAPSKPSSRDPLADPVGLDEWRALAENAVEPNPFYEAWYLTPSLTHLDHSATLFAFRQAGRLAGLIPLTGQAFYAGRPIPHLAGWLHANAFCGAPLVARGAEDAFWTALLDHADAAPGAGLFLHLQALDADGPLLAALASVCARQGRRARVVCREERALLASPLAPQAYLEAAMSGKKRKELRRQHRRLGEEGALVFERTADDAGLDRWIDTFLALERAGWKGREGSALASDPRKEALFRAALGGAAAAGRLERLSLMLDGRAIGMLVNFLCPPAAFSFKTAYDERYARYSPGVLLQRENLALLTRDDIAWTDSCAAADHPMIERIWRQKRRMVRVSVAIGGRARRAAFAALSLAESGTPLEASR